LAAPGREGAYDPIRDARRAKCVLLRDDPHTHRRARLRARARHCGAAGVVRGTPRGGRFGARSSERRVMRRLIADTENAGNRGEGWFHVTAENDPPAAGVSYANADGVAGGPVTEGSDVFITVSGLQAEMDPANIDDLSVWVDWRG